MIEKEQLVDFLERIAMKEDLGEMVTIEQMEEVNRKLLARIDVQQGQLDGLQALIGAMQVKITQLQLQVVKMEGILAEQQIVEDMCVKQKPVEEAVKQVVEEKPVEEKPVEEKPVEEKPIEDKPAEEPVEEEVEVKEVVENVKEKTGAQTIADSIKGEKSLAEKLSKYVEKETVASNINASKIERIQTAITIADRFRFQRELFDGDAVKMAETVEMLNDMKNLDEALAYIEKNFHWNVEIQVTRDFLRLVERRFLN